MFANDDNEKTIKTYASLLQGIREGNDIGEVNEADQKQIKSWHPPSNAAGQRALAKGLTDYSKKIGKDHMDHKDFADHAKHVKAGAWDKVRTHANGRYTEVRDKIHSLAIKHLGLRDASELYGEHGDMSESYGGDRNEIDQLLALIDEGKTLEQAESYLAAGRDTHMVDIDHTGGQDDNAKMHNITIKKSQMDDGTHTANSHDATGSKKDLQKYLAKHYDDAATAKELHPEIYK